MSESRGQPVRRAVEWFLTLILRIFFRRIEVVGMERVPLEGPMMYVVNHPNALMDPLFLICLGPRRVALLAKTPLFRMFFVGWFVRKLECLPVYRTQDEGNQVQKNRETFSRARQLLARGVAITIFPEGVSHSDTRLKPLKSGAARIALGSGVEGLKIVPAGLYYTAKWTFRSSALLYVGEPIDVAASLPGPDGEPPRAEVRALTERIREALSKVMIEAEGGQERTLAERFELRRSFMERYLRLKQSSPERLARLESRIRRFETVTREYRVDPVALAIDGRASPRALFELGANLFWIGVVLPAAAYGFLAHYLVYRLVGPIAVKASKGEDDMIATIKVLAAMLFFPLNWLAIAGLIGAAFGAKAALLNLLALPLSGIVALLFIERIDPILSHTRALSFFLFRRRFLARLRRERAAIRQLMLELARDAVPEQAGA